MTTLAPPMCMSCVHLDRDPSEEWGFRCAAFPDGIPEPIFRSERDHREPFRGDQGIRFEQADDLPEPLFGERLYGFELTAAEREVT